MCWPFKFFGFVTIVCGRGTCQSKTTAEGGVFQHFGVFNTPHAITGVKKLASETNAM